MQHLPSIWYSFPDLLTGWEKVLGTPLSTAFCACLISPLWKHLFMKWSRCWETLLPSKRFRFINLLLLISVVNYFAYLISLTNKNFPQKFLQLLQRNLSVSIFIQLVKNFIKYFIVRHRIQTHLRANTVDEVSDFLLVEVAVGGHINRLEYFDHDVMEGLLVCKDHLERLVSLVQLCWSQACQCGFLLCRLVFFGRLLDWGPLSHLNFNLSLN